MFIFGQMISHHSTSHIELVSLYLTTALFDAGDCFDIEVIMDSESMFLYPISTISFTLQGHSYQLLCDSVNIFAATD